MSGFLARLVARSVHPPEAGQANAAVGRSSVADQGPWDDPARDASAGSIRPRLPSRYERAFPEAAAALDVEVGVDALSVRRESQVAAPSPEPSGERGPSRPVSGTGRAAAAEPGPTCDAGESVVVVPGLERRGPAAGSFAGVEAGRTAPQALEVPQVGRPADQVTERVVTRRVHEGMLASPVTSSGRADPMGTAGEPAPHVGDVPTDNAPPAPVGPAVRGTGPLLGSPLSEPTGERPVRRPDLGLRASVRHRRASGTTVIPQPSDVSSRRRPRAPAAPDPPRIRVSIGRVEVRAVQSAQVPAASTEPRRPAGPLTSLDEYLEQREGGA